MNYYQGRFTPKHPEKYLGDPTKIIYRSSWEFRCLKFLDSNPNILKYASEEIIIPYAEPSTGNYRRYFPDFYVEAKQKNGNIAKMIWEIKPQSQIDPPKQQTKMTRKYINEVYTYSINQAKWEAARKYCDKRDWKFMVLSEKDLGLE